MPTNRKYFDLKKLRDHKNWTQEELSIKIKINRGRLSRIENYKEKLTFLQVQNLYKHVINLDEYSLDETQIGLGKENGKEYLLKEIENLKQIISLKDELLKVKSEQIELLKRQSSSPVPASSFSLSNLDESGEFVDWKIIDLPKNEYIEFHPNCFIRYLESKEQLIADWESIFEPYLDFDFSQYKVMLNKASKNVILNMHYHVEVEHIIVVKGGIFDHVSGRQINEGESITLASMQKHHMQYLHDSFLVVLLESN